MRALVLRGRGEIAYVEKPEPKLLSPHGALLRPKLISPCTSDVHTIWQGSPKKPELTLGHECLAEIAEVGGAVRDFRPGELVAVSAVTPDWSQPDVFKNYAHAGYNFSAHMLGKSIDGAFQELFYLPYADRNLARIPEGMDLLDALMAVDVCQTGFTAAEEGEVRKGQEIAVLGIGAIGLSAILAARHYGAKRIFAVGSRRENAEIAKSFSDGHCQVELIDYKSCVSALPEGLHPLANSTGSPVVNEILKRTALRGVDSVLLCGGDAKSFPMAVDMVKYGTGIVSNVMYFGAEPGREKLQEEHRGIDALEIPKFSIGRGMAGKTLRFSLSKGGRENLERILHILTTERLHPGCFVTKQYQGLDKTAEAIYDMKERRAIKIAISV